jgi:hypothetical protein
MDKVGENVLELETRALRIRQYETYVRVLFEEKVTRRERTGGGGEQRDGSWGMLL